MTTVKFVKSYQDAGRVQGEFLGQAMQMEIEALEKDGYEITHIIPVISGHGEDDSDLDVETDKPSFTSGVLIVARKP